MSLANMTDAAVARYYEAHLEGGSRTNARVAVEQELSRRVRSQAPVGPLVVDGIAYHWVKADRSFLRIKTVKPRRNLTTTVKPPASAVAMATRMLSAAPEGRRKQSTVRDES